MFIHSLNHFTAVSFPTIPKTKYRSTYARRLAHSFLEATAVHPIPHQLCNCYAAALVTWPLDEAARGPFNTEKRQKK